MLQILADFLKQSLFKKIEYKTHPVCIKRQYLGKKVVMMDLENSRRICLFVHVVMGHGKFEIRKPYFRFTWELKTFGTNLEGKKWREMFQIFGHSPLYSRMIWPTIPENVWVLNPSVVRVLTRLSLNKETFKKYLGMLKVSSVCAG